MSSSNLRLATLSIVLAVQLSHAFHREVGASCRANKSDAGSPSFVPTSVAPRTKCDDSRTHAPSSTGLCMAAGRGMGMGSTAPPKKGKKSGGGGSGMGMASGGKPKGKKKKQGGSAPFDVAAALLRSERLYEELCADAAKEIAESDDGYGFDTITTEYVVAAKCAQSSDANAAAATASVSDWVPVAQMVTMRPVSDALSSSSAQDDGEHRDSIRTAVSANCREIYHAATIAAPVFKSLPRNEVQYGAEPIDSFYRYVYDDVIEGKGFGGGGSGESSYDAMTKARARTVLDLEEGCTSMRDIKRAYRHMSFRLHPDRFVGVERSEEEKRDAAREFADVKAAYETLCSGIRDGSERRGSGNGKSWYESLGGKQRTEFYAPIGLKSIDGAKKTIEGRGEKSAVVGLDYDIVMSFVARNQAAAAT